MLHDLLEILPDHGITIAPKDDEHTVHEKALGERIFGLADLDDSIFPLSEVAAKNTDISLVVMGCSEQVS